jgi:hypothetical protein
MCLAARQRGYVAEPDGYGTRQDDLAFARRLAGVNVGGHLIIHVPGRRDRWSIEDETNRTLAPLRSARPRAGPRDADCARTSPEVDCAVPANLLFHAGNLLLRLGGGSQDRLSRGRNRREAGFAKSRSRRFPGVPHGVNKC